MNEEEEVHELTREQDLINKQRLRDEHDELVTRRSWNPMSGEEEDY